MLLKTIDEIKLMTIDDIVKKKVNVKIYEQDCNKITLAEDICDLLTHFKFSNNIQSTTYNQNIYRSKVNFMIKKLGIIPTGYYTPVFQQNFNKYINGPIREIFGRKEKDKYIIVVDELLSCSDVFNAGREYNYPIYRVLKIFDDRRKRKIKKVKEAETKKFELELHMMGLLGDLNLDESVKIETFKNTYSNDPLKSWYVAITCKKSFYRLTIFCHDLNSDTFILNNENAKFQMILTRDNLSKLLNTFKEIGVI